MIDVHPPHESVHTWKDFFIHIATIVVGLLIAIGLEQTVEYFHHRHQAHEATEALHEESMQNRDLSRMNLKSIAESIRLINLNRAKLEQFRKKGTAAGFRPVPDVQTIQLLAPVDTAWLTLRDNGLLSIVQPRLADTYWKVDFMAHRVADDITAVGTKGEEVEALVHLHNDSTQLSPGESAQLALAYSQLQEALVHVRSSERAYAVGNEIGLSGGVFDARAFSRNWDPQ